MAQRGARGAQGRPCGAQGRPGGAQGRPRGALQAPRGVHGAPRAAAQGGTTIYIPTPDQPHKRPLVTFVHSYALHTTPASWFVYSQTRRHKSSG